MELCGIPVILRTWFCVRPTNVSEKTTRVVVEDNSMLLVASAPCHIPVESDGVKRFVSSGSKKAFVSFIGTFWLPPWARGTPSPTLTATVAKTQNQVHLVGRHIRAMSFVPLYGVVVIEVPVETCIRVCGFLCRSIPETGIIISFLYDFFFSWR